MREVVELSSVKGEVSDLNNNNNSGNGSPMRMVGSIIKSVVTDIKMSSMPGYLELTPEKMDRLIINTPIEDVYEVEDQPFARGKYAAVRRCRHRTSGQQFAAKFLKKYRRSTDLRPEILHEVAILDACQQSSKIVRLHQVYESKYEMVLLLELAPGGELQMLLDNDEIPDESQVKIMMRQILDGLIYLHSINVAHLDLKPQNLVLTGDFPHCEVKLCDLGISRYISDGADIRDILGTPDYVAPEVLNYESISLATDMWSVGVLLYVLLTGCSPFGGDTKQETFCNISQCNLDFPDDLFEEISQEVIDLMKKLMVKDPSKRLSATQCLEHVWFTSDTALSSSTIAAAGPIKTLLPKTDEFKTSPAPIRKLDSSNATKASAKHKAPVETSIIDKSLDYQTPEILITKPDTPIIVRQEVKELKELKEEVKEVSVPSVGMKSFRRENFKRNLSELAERLAKTNENNVILEEKPVKTPVFSAEVITEESKCDLGRMRKCKSMHMLPIGDQFDANRTHPNLNFNANEVKRRVLQHRDVYSFRKCIVTDDDDISPPMSIAGSVTSSVASDQSISDSGSELSIDSSSDRSSIISLDDSIEYNARTGRYSANVWNKRMSLSSNDSFANAFRRFSGHADDSDRQRSVTMPRRPARGAHTVVVNKMSGPTVKTMCKLEFRKETYGNVVVIREVKAGRFLQVSEVKCESVQERIRRLQDQSIKKT